MNENGGSAKRKLIFLIYKGRIPGGVLNTVLVISVVITTLITAVMMMAYYRSELLHQHAFRQELDRNAQSGLQYILATENLSYHIPRTLDLFDNFTNARISSILVFLCREYQLDIRITGTILSFFRYLRPQEFKPVLPAKNLRLSYDASTNLLTSDLQNDSLVAFAKQVTQLSRKNVVLAPGLNNRLLNGYVEAMPFEAALDKIAFANSLKLSKTKDNAFLLQPEADQQTGAAGGGQSNFPPSPYRSSMPAGLSIEIQAGEGGTKSIHIDAINIPIAQLIHEVSDRLGVNYVLFSESQGNTTTRVKGVDYEYFLNFLLQGTTHTFKESEGI